MSKEITTKSEALKECPKPRVNITNIDTGETIDLPCKSWNCEFCRPKKKKKLKHYIVAQTTNEFDVLCLVTFTLRAGLGHPPNSIRKDWKGHYKLLQELTKRFNTEIRRDANYKSLKNMSYIMINETHKSGYAHKHFLTDSYIPQEYFNRKLNEIAKQVIKSKTGEKPTQEWVAHFDISFVQDNRQFGGSDHRKLKNIRNYISKQLTKHDQKEGKQQATRWYITKQMKQRDLTSEMDYTKKPFRKFWSKTKNLPNYRKKKENDGTRWVVTLTEQRRSSLVLASTN